jgi:hypothetical protein
MNERVVPAFLDFAQILPDCQCKSVLIGLETGIILDREGHQTSENKNKKIPWKQKLSREK